MAKVRIAGFTDDFSGALSGYDNGPGDYSTMAVSGGLLQAAATATPTGIVRNTGGYSPDQYAKITINNITAGAAGNSASAFVRHAGGTTEACYLVDVNGDSGTYRYAIYEVDNTFGFTQLSTNGSGAAVTTPFNVIIEAEGTALRVYSDEGGSESLRTSTTDATLTSGRPGCGIYVDSSTTDSQISDFECGSLWEQNGNWKVAWGPYTSGTANISPVTVDGHAADDYLLCVAHSAGGENIVLGTANGFGELPNSPSATGAGTAGVKVGVFGQLADSAAESGPTVTDPGDHCGGVIFVIRHASGAPTVGVTGSNQKASATTSFSVSGGTTTANDSLVLAISGRDTDSAAAAYSAATNADLSGLVELFDLGTTSGNGGGLAVFMGVDPTAGSVGATTGTVSSSINANYFIGFAPPSVGGLTPSSGGLSIAGVAPTVTRQDAIVPSAGGVTATGLAPQVSAGGSVSIQPSTGAAQITGNAPLVSRQDTIRPTVGALIAAGNTPALGASRTIQPTAGGLIAAGIAPSIDLTLPAPLAGVLTLSGGTPGVSISIARAPTVGAVAIAGNAPTVTRQTIITPSAGVMTLSGQLAVTGGQVVISPSAGAISLAGLNASLTHQLYRAPQIGALAWSGLQPSVTVSAAGVRQPLVGTLALQGNTPTVTRQDEIRPTIAAVAIAGQQPTVTQALQRTPTVGAASLQGLAPTIQATNSFTISPASGQIVLGANAAVTSSSLSIRPNAGSLSASGIQPIVSYSGDAVSGHWNLRAPGRGLLVAGSRPTLRPGS